MKNKDNLSWFDRLLGRKPYYDYDDYEEEEYENGYYEDEEINEEEGYEDEYDEMADEEDEGEGRQLRAKEEMLDLQINLIDRSDKLIAQAIVAGIDEDDIDITITREMLEIQTSSNQHCIERDGDVLYEELISGSFSRSLLLPAEIDVDQSKAAVKNGVLTVTMPKIDKTTQKKLSVKGNN